jgi:hypothetical protein
MALVKNIVELSPPPLNTDGVNLPSVEQPTAITLECNRF